MGRQFTTTDQVTKVKHVKRLPTATTLWCSDGVIREVSHEGNRTVLRSMADVTHAVLPLLLPATVLTVPVDGITVGGPTYPNAVAAGRMGEDRIPVAVCGKCADYAEDDALLYLDGTKYRHLGNGRVRCPGQEDDDTHDRAWPFPLAAFADRDPELMARILVAHVTRDLPAHTDRLLPIG